MKQSLLSLLLAGLISPLAIAPAWAQRVVNVTPQVNGEEVSPDASISGQFDTSGGTTVQTDSVTLTVNGEDVTGMSTITPNFFSYRPSQPFAPGPIDVQVEYVGSDGVRRVVSWQFTVQPPRPAVEITAITHNAASNPLGPNSTFLVTLNGTPNEQASALLVRNGQTVQSIAAEEVSPGVYVASLTVGSNESLEEGIVVGKLQSGDETAYAIAQQPAVFTRTTAADSTPETVEASAPDTDAAAAETATETVALAPAFTSHQEGDIISGRRFTLTGQTRPGATVNVVVDASTSVFGLASVGENLVDRQVVADENGQFQVEVPLGVLNSSGTVYDITATAALDGEAATTEMRLRHQ